MKFSMMKETFYSELSFIMFLNYCFIYYYCLLLYVLLNTLGLHVLTLRPKIPSENIIVIVSDHGWAYQMFKFHMDVIKCQLSGLSHIFKKHETIKTKHLSDSFTKQVQKKSRVVYLSESDKKDSYSHKKSRNRQQNQTAVFLQRQYASTGLQTPTSITSILHTTTSVHFHSCSTETSLRSVHGPVE